MSSAAVRALVVTAAALLVIAVGGCGAGSRAPGAGATGTVTVAFQRTLNSFVGNPLGGSLDGHGPGDIVAIYTAANLRAMRSAALSRVAYRLRTELASEAWHWNPVGRFSDVAHQQGYWTSSAEGRLPGVVYGYRLPRRGNTIDQANNDGYSRVDDGDPRTYWKSNPYLDPHYTHEPEAAHPQWVMLDLGQARPVDALRLDWADPYAARFAVQAWDGATPPARYGAERENAVFANGIVGRWVPLGSWRGRRGSQLVRLGPARRRARWLRVYMTASSHTRPRGSRDVRDGLGFALREIYAGELVGGRLHDFVRHGASNTTQSVVWVSSTDPWHRAGDRDPGVEQPSFDRVYASGLARGRGVLMPVALAYGTPADAVAELRYLRRRGFALSGVELGEEPDGQLLGPDDYGSLYTQFARALRRVDRRVPLGGPSFSTAVPDWTVWPDGHASTSWTGRMVAQLRALHALAQLQFFSFEWYPVDDVCAPVGAALASAAGQLADVVARQRRAGLPAGLPIDITEFGYSAFAAAPELDRAGAISDADTIGGLLALGGRSGYVYGVEPDTPIRESAHCASYGNLTLFESDDSHRIEHPTAAYWLARLLAHRWFASPRAGPQRMLATAGPDLRDAAGRPLIGVYALRRADGALSLLLVNRDQLRAHALRVALSASAGTTSHLAGALDLYQLSARDYAWHPRGAHGYASPDRPPLHAVVTARAVAHGALTLPPASVSVLVTRRTARARPG